MFKNQRGGAAVEFAIVVPLLVLILFGTIDFALLFYNKQVITNASREGARSAIVKENQTVGITDPPVFNFSDQEQIITDYYTGRLKVLNEGGDLPVSAFTATDADGAPVTDPDAVVYIIATVTYVYKHFFHFLGLPEETTITGQTVMRSEE